MPPIKPTATTPPLLWSPLETARALGVSTRKLWAMTASGEIPSLKLGRLVKYRPDAVAAYLARIEQNGDSAA